MLCQHTLYKRLYVKRTLWSKLNSQKWQEEGIPMPLNFNLLLLYDNSEQCSLNKQLFIFCFALLIYGTLFVPCNEDSVINFLIPFLIHSSLNLSASQILLSLKQPSEMRGEW